MSLSFYQTDEISDVVSETNEKRGEKDYCVDDHQLILEKSPPVPFRDIYQDGMHHFYGIIKHEEMKYRDELDC